MNRTAPEVQCITLEGEYDLARKDELVSHLSTVSKGSPVTIDMRAVTYIDSTFLGELAAFRVRLENESVTLAGVQPNIQRVLSITNLDRFFAFADSPPA